MISRGFLQHKAMTNVFQSLLLVIAGATQKELARQVKYRSEQTLEEDRVIDREKIRRQNQYRILEKQFLRHPIESHCTIGDLISLVVGGVGK